MARKRRGGANHGHGSAKVDKVCLSFTPVLSAFRHLQGPLQALGAEKAPTSTSAHSTSSIPLTAMLAKSSKKPIVPGRVLSLHNLPSATTASDILRFVSPIEIVAYKRTAHSDTSALSGIAFVMCATADDARRVFLRLYGAIINGATVRVNFVNGVKFEGQNAMGKEVG